jgi:hypothetical protein
MAQYTKVVNGDSVRYKDGGKFVKADDVPQNIKDTLEKAPQGTVVDELGDIVDPSTETDEGSGDDESVPTATPPVEDDTTTEDESTEDDESDEDEADDEEETQEEAPAPKARTSRAKTEIGGMGFPAKNGKTLSIFSDKPHETVKNVGGIMVPLTLVELNGDRANGVEPKTDTEILEKLKKLGKV